MLVEDAMEVENGLDRNTEEVAFDEQKVQLSLIFKKYDLLLEFI